MSQHTATVRWAITEGDFLKGRYSRVHTWTFDGGAAIAASPSPSVVPVPYSCVPTAEQKAQLHERAHHDCFISNSVKTDIAVVPASEHER